jgi:hypothetical protein
MFECFVRGEPAAAQPPLTDRILVLAELAPDPAHERGVVHRAGLTCDLASATKIASVGMLRMPKREAVQGASSVLSFASCTPGSSTPAASSKAGAIMRHGPHQGAQKSTTMGRSDLVTCRSKLSSFNGTGFPVNSASLHRPQRACSPIRS